MPIIDMVLQYHNKKYIVKDLIGEGVYTNAYSLKSGKVLCVSTSDTTKRVLITAQKAKNPHIPKIRLVSADDSDQVYRMPLYKTFREWNEADETCPALKQGTAIQDHYWSDWGRDYSISHLSQCFAFCNSLEDNNIVPLEIINGMRVILNCAKKQGYNAACDFHNGNWATTVDGETLIILDAFNIFPLY